MQAPSPLRRWLLTASVTAGLSMFYLACGGDIGEFPDEDGGISRDAGRTGQDGGPEDPLCTGVVCSPGFSCVNGLCEQDTPTSGIAGP